MSFEFPNLGTFSGTLAVANGGTNSSTPLSGSSITVSNGTSIVQGNTGTSHQVLHGNLSFSAVALSSDVTGVLPVANGGSGFDTFSAGQLLIGNTGGTLTKSTLTAGDNVYIINGASGSIEIGVTGVGGSTPTTTEYDSPSGNPYTYNIPASSKYLDIVLIGGGGGGGGGSSSATNPGAGGGGGAGMYRNLRIPVESGVTTATVTIGAGGSGGSIGSIGSAGTQSTVVINGKTIYAAAGGAGAPGRSGGSGGGGGSAGAANGGNGNNSTGGAAGSSTPPGNTHYRISVSGIAGSNGQTAGFSVAPASPGALTTNLWIIGGAGTGPSSYQGASEIGGDCQGLIFQTPSTFGLHGPDTNCTGGGNGGSSGKSLGGRGAYFSSFTRTDATPGTYGSGGGGGLGSNIGQASAGASGGSGFCSISPVF